MKFQVIATLLGAASTINIDKIEDTQFIQEAESLQETCKDYNSIDSSNLIEISADESIEEQTDRPKLEGAKSLKGNVKEDKNKHIKNTYKKHFGKTKEQIDKENKHILDT